MLRSTGERSSQSLLSNFSRVCRSFMLVDNSNRSPAFFGAATKRRNSRDLLQRYLSPRQVMSLSPLVDQFATEVNTAARAGGRFVAQKPSTTGWRVGNHLNPCVGTGNFLVPTFSPKVNSARCRRRYSMVDLAPLSILI